LNYCFLADKQGGENNTIFFVVLVVCILIVLAVSKKSATAPNDLKVGRYSGMILTATQPHSFLLFQQSIPDADQERSARAARLARFGGGDTDMPSDTALRERKTVSIAARNKQAASTETEAASTTQTPSKEAEGSKRKEGDKKPEYWGGDSTVYEPRDD
jgi:hypothetical protein